MCFVYLIKFDQHKYFLSHTELYIMSMNANFFLGCYAHGFSLMYSQKCTIIIHTTHSLKSTLTQPEDDVGGSCALLSFLPQSQLIHYFSRYSFY